MFGKAFLVAPVLHAQYTPEVQQKNLKENEGWNRDNKKQLRHLCLQTLPSLRA